MYIVYSYAKIRHLNFRKDKPKIKGVLCNYDKETIETSRNHFVTQHFAFITLVENERQTVRLKYDGITFFYKPFKEGEEIDVFWYAGELYLWNAYQEGVFRLALSKWPFFA